MANVAVFFNGGVVAWKTIQKSMPLANVRVVTIVLLLQLRKVVSLLKQRLDWMHTLMHFSFHKLLGQIQKLHKLANSTQATLSQSSGETADLQLQSVNKTG